MATVIVYDKERMQEIEDGTVTSGTVNELGSLILTTKGGASIDAGAVMDPLIPGTTAEYYRGDKTWQTLNKAAVGLGSVDNTTDLAKPISTAQKAQFIGRGTATQRDAYYGVPATAAERAALANQKVVWYNTTTNSMQMYFATTGTAGLTEPGIIQTSGWYNELGSAYRKIILATPSGHTLIDEFSVTRSGAMVNIKGRLNRTTSQNAILPAGGLPVGFRPTVNGAVFNTVYISSALQMLQVNSDGSVATPFSTATGDTMISVNFATDPSVLPY